MGRITKQDYYKVLRHWEDNVVASIEGEWGNWDSSAINCAFCSRLRNGYWVDCDKCPIYENTGHVRCGDTPWVFTCDDDPDSNWEEYQYLLTLALSNGAADKYLNEIDWKE